MKSMIVPPTAEHWFKAFESAEKAVEAMRFLVKRNKVLLDRNKRLREEIKRLTNRPRAHPLNGSSV